MLDKRRAIIASVSRIDAVLVNAFLQRETSRIHHGSYLAASNSLSVRVNPAALAGSLLREAGVIDKEINKFIHFG